MEAREHQEELSLLGGPLHRLGCHLGLVRDRTNTLAMGLAIGLSLWLVLVVLAFLQGSGHQLFALDLIGGHVRLLLVIPLLFLCESVLDPRMTTFAQMIVRSGVVPDHARPKLQSEIHRISRWRDSWLPEVMCLLVAVLLAVAGPKLQLFGTTSTIEAGKSLSDLSLAGQWYWMVCLTLFRFLLLRWIWRIALWCFFLWRVTKLDLHLVPTHPDCAGGLGYLEVVHTHFTPLILAISAIQSASLAEDIVSGRAPFEAIYPSLALVLMVNAVLFLGPLFIVAPKLWVCRIKGLSHYMEFAAGYVSGFDKKWLGSTPPPPGELLGTADLQSLADLSNSINVVRNMRWVPMSLTLGKDIVIASLLPMLPLLLLQYPIAKLLEKFITRLVGL